MTKDSSFTTPSKTFWFAIRPYRTRFFAMCALIIAGNIFGYSLPYFFKLIADKAIAAPFAQLSFGDFTFALIGMGIFLVGQEVSFRLAHALERSHAPEAFDRITTHIYTALIRRPAAYFEDKFSGEIARRIEQIGSGVKFFIDDFPWVMSWPIMSTTVSIVLLGMANLWLVAFFGAWIVLFLIFSFFLVRWQYRETQKMSEAHAALSGTLVDALGNVSLIQAFAADAHEYDHFRTFMNNTVSAEKLERKAGLYNRLHQGISAIVLTAGLVLVSITLFLHGLITLGDFVIVASVIATIDGVVWAVGETIMRAIHVFGDMKNAIESLNAEIPYVAEGAESLHAGTPSITFAHVSFAYPASPKQVVSDVSFTVNAGEKVGLVGHSGAGKSTLVKLLLRSYELGGGSISIGAQNTSTLTFDSLRSNIAFVPQDTALFHRSLFDNIKYAKPDATPEAVLQASIRAHADDFIKEYPAGYDTKVGERGVKLSGGQRQRIALARAILKDAPILVLDEATSALDSESEEIVQKGLYELFEQRTVIAIAHRLSTLHAMDRIIVLDEGKIVEDGSPQELLANEKSIFKAMWGHQKSGFIE